MQNFAEILDNIKSELEELERINKELMQTDQIAELESLIQQLREENAELRKRLEMPIRNNNDLLSATVAFSSFCLRDGLDSMRTRAYNALYRSGITHLGNLRGKHIEDLMRIRNAGSSVVAVLYLLLEHYDIKIKVPEEPRKEVKEVLKKAEIYRQSITFKV